MQPWSDQDNRRGSREPCRARRAFSSIEAAIATVILAVALVTGMNLYGSYAHGASMGIDGEIGQELAAEMLSEVLSRAFEEPSLPAGSFGREAGENYRADFDDVDDYNGLLEARPLRPDSKVRSDAIYASYSRRVSVRNVDEATLSTSAANGATGAKVVRVMVYKGTKLVADMLGYRTRHAASD